MNWQIEYQRHVCQADPSGMGETGKATVAVSKPHLKAPPTSRPPPGTAPGGDAKDTQALTPAGPAPRAWDICGQVL